MGVGNSPEEICHVNVIRQRRRQAHDPDETLRGFDLAERPRNDRLDDRSTVFVQQVHLVDDQELDFLWAHAYVSNMGVGTETACSASHLCDLAIAAAGSSSRHDVPLLGRRHDNRRLVHFLLRELHVSSQFADLDARPREPFGEFERDFGGESLEGRDVDNLERGGRRSFGASDMLVSGDETRVDKQRRMVRRATSVFPWILRAGQFSRPRESNKEEHAYGTGRGTD